MKRNHPRPNKGTAVQEKRPARSGQASPGSAAGRSAVRHALLLAALLAVTLLAYSNSFRVTFLVDNEEIILNDTRVHALTTDHLRRILTQQYWETSNTGLYRPLTTLSFLFNYAVLGDGTDPYGYHWFNWGVHAWNIVLVYALGLAVFKRIPDALLLGAVWGLHPVLTEAVTNIVGRSDLLAAFGVLAALLCHRKATEARGARKGAWLAAIGLASAIGIFSKESGIVVLAALVIYDLAFGGSGSWSRRLPGYAAAAIPCLLFLLARWQVLTNASHLSTPFYENPLLGAGFWTARMTAIKVIGRYFGLLVWPAHLSWDYAYHEVPLFGWSLSTVEDWKNIAALFGCAGAAALAFLSWRRRRVGFFAIAFFFGALAPTSNLILLIGATMGERFLYLPSLGFAIGVVWAWHAVRERVSAGRPLHRYLAGAGIIAALIGCCARTYARNGDWLDQQRFWLSAVAATPGSYKANMAAATNTVLASEQDVARSVQYADQALEILDGLPDSLNSPSAYYDAGMFFRRIGDRVASQERSGTIGNRQDPQAWYRKSLHALLRSERLELVWDELYRAENARRGRPGLTSLPSKLYLALGRTYSRLADAPHALQALERGRVLESSPDLLEDLASAYRAAGQPRKAAQALVEAMAMDPNRPQAAAAAIQLYEQIDPHGCSVAVQGGTPTLDPDCPLVHSDICAASRNVIGNYLRRGQQAEAASIRKVAEQDLGCAAESLQ